MKFKFFVFLICIVFSVELVYSLGCCVGPEQNMCSTNSNRDSCENFGGTYYDNDASCSTVRVCDSGCCMLGLNSARMVRGKCQKETQLAGFSTINFLQTNEDCGTYILSQEWGSCVSSDSFDDKICRFVTRAQCAGEFFENTLCTNIQGSKCEKTEEGVCFGNSAYKIDSCGNRDSLIENCDYNSGSICKEDESGGKKSASCFTANCKDNFDYTRFILSNLYSSAPVYSPTERKQGDTWCVTSGMVPFREDELTRNFNQFGAPISGVSGLGFFSRSCIDGQIVTEACGDGKDGYCSGSSSWEDTDSIVGTGGRCVTNEWRNCITAENEEDCDLNNCFWFAPEKITKGSSKMIADLGIAKCLPRVPAGYLESTSASSVCSLGDYETTFSFVKSMNRLTKTSNTLFGNAGLLLGGEADWKFKSTTSLEAGENNLYLNKGMVKSISKGDFPFIVLNPEAVAFLEYRCSMLYDCTGKMNWEGISGRNSSSGIVFLSAQEIKNEFNTGGVSLPKKLEEKLNSYLRKTGLNKDDFSGYPADKFPVLFGKESKKTMDLKFEYNCVPRRAPINGDCKKCTEDGVFCTKYSCESIGSNCEYTNLGGFGVCENKGDITSPQITVNCPDSSSLKINQPIRINVTTSEIAQCRFSIGNPSASYDGMQYSLGNQWGNTHEAILISPGYSSPQFGNVTQYPLITKSGTYDLYARCVDPKGNGASDPSKLCQFNVPASPDKNPPIILEFSPINNTPITFNTTSKEVKILVNEPVECKWSMKDQEFDSMINEFSCDSNLAVRGGVTGYECVSDLSGVTNVSGSSTKFYIRCKDQPDLEDDEVYTRNSNTKSFVYYLKASHKLEITEISPRGRIMLGPKFNDWNLTVRTSGGGYNGITECKWKFNLANQSSIYSSFSTTQSTSKSQPINQNIPGNYILSVICADDSGNVANHTSPFEIRYDRTAPSIIRVYNDKGNLKIVTSESAFCKFSSSIGIGFGLGCSFSMTHPNITAMISQNNVEHSHQAIKGSSYFVKCQDFYGNENSACGLITKTI